MQYPLLNSHWSSSPLSSSCLPDLKELVRDTVGAVYLCFPHTEVATFQGCLRIGVLVRAMLHPFLNWECLCPHPALFCCLQPALCRRILLSSTCTMREDSAVLNHFTGENSSTALVIQAHCYFYVNLCQFTSICVGKISFFTWFKNCEPKYVSRRIGPPQWHRR